MRSAAEETTLCRIFPSESQGRRNSYHQISLSAGLTRGWAAFFPPDFGTLIYERAIQTLVASTLSHPTVIPYGRGKAILQPTVCHLERNDVGSPLIAGCFCVESITSRYLDRVGREETLAIECPIARFFNYLFLALLVPAWQLTLSSPQLSHTLSIPLSPHTPEIRTRETRER